MPTKPTKPDWNSTPNEYRHRKPINISLSVEERKALDELSELTGQSRSEVVGGEMVRALARLKKSKVHPK